MKNSNIKVSMQDVIFYFEGDNSECNCELSVEFVGRILVMGFDSSISPGLGYALRAWAQAENGRDSQYASEFVKRKLNMDNEKSNTSREQVLLKAAYDILKKCNEGSYVKDVLRETAFYDETDCDGYCLATDIAELLGINREDFNN